MANSAHTRFSSSDDRNAATGMGNKGSTQAARLFGSLTVLPGIGATFLPALTCPLCWPAYTGLLSALGLGFINYTPYLLPLTSVFLAVALAVLGYYAIKRKVYGPFVLGLTGATTLVVGKFVLSSDPVLYGGIALLVGASARNAWPRKTDASCELPSSTARQSSSK